jgi:predicted DNA-binding transcriptional regulator AlpA
MFNGKLHAVGDVRAWLSRHHKVRDADLIDMGDIAEHLGCSVATVRWYRAHRGFPEPDVRIGQTPYWRPATVGPWIEQRTKANA